MIKKFPFYFQKNFKFKFIPNTINFRFSKLANIQLLIEKLLRYRQLIFLKFNLSNYINSTLSIPLFSSTKETKHQRIANRYSWRGGRRRIRVSFRKWKNPDGFFPAFVPASISSSSIRVSATILQNHHWNGGSPHALYIHVYIHIYVYVRV